MQPSRRFDPFWGVVFVFIVVLGGGLFLLFSRKAPALKSSPAKIKHIIITEAPSPSPKKGGLLRLVTDKADDIAGMGQDINVSVVANSDEKKIRGYDVVLTYDPNAVSVVSVQNGVSDYQIFSQKKTGSYTVSGILLTQETPLHVFQGTSLLTFLVRPIKKGETKLSLMYVDGSKADCNLITDLDSDILVRTEGVMLTIGDELRLSEGISQEIPGTGITLTLKQTIIPSKVCRDCLTQANIVVIKDKETMDISLHSGGFAGKTNGKAGAFGHSFSLVEIQAGWATLIATLE